MGATETASRGDPRGMSPGARGRRATVRRPGGPAPPPLALVRRAGSGPARACGVGDKEGSAAPGPCRGSRFTTTCAGGPPESAPSRRGGRYEALGRIVDTHRGRRPCPGRAVRVAGPGRRPGDEASRARHRRGRRQRVPGPQSGRADLRARARHQAQHRRDAVPDALREARHDLPGRRAHLRPRHARRPLDAQVRDRGVAHPPRLDVRLQAGPRHPPRDLRSRDLAAASRPRAAEREEQAAAPPRYHGRRQRRDVHVPEGPLPGAPELERGPREREEVQQAGKHGRLRRAGRGHEPDRGGLSADPLVVRRRRV